MSATSAAPALDGELLEALARRHGTPLYVYDLDLVESRYRVLRGALGPGMAVFYAVKANPARAILHLLGALGAGADVASEGELAAALDGGIAPRRIVLTGPGKSDAFIGAAVAARVAAIHAEGPHEVARIDRIAARAGRRRQPVSIRVNPGWGIAERRRIIGGAGAHKFGVDLPTAHRMWAEIARRRHVRLAGIQVFNASNVLEARLLHRNVRRVLALAERLAGSHRTPLGMVDVGGGLGIPYAAGEEALDVVALGRGIAGALRVARRSPWLGRTRLILEPGRFLVGPAGLYVTRVVEVKTTRGARHAVVDGGIHQLLRPALFGAAHRMELLRSPAKRPATLASFAVGGPLCTSLDVLHPAALLPADTGPGDLLVVRDAGAYGFTESMPLFLSHGWPAEVGVRGGTTFLMRPRADMTALLHEQVAGPDGTARRSR